MIELKNIAKECRKDILLMCHSANSSHIGSAMSIIDILTVLYFKVLNISKKNLKSNDRDIFILSKGHAATALYAILKQKGFIEDSIKENYCKAGNYFGQHISSKIPGVELSTGSLGHGLSVSAGIAMAKRIDNNKGKIYVLLGDGECNEGSIWEAAEFISAEKLGIIKIIIDSNRFQGLKSGSRILPKEKNIAMWKALGFNVKEVDGHSFEELYSALTDEKIQVIFAETIKGKGVSYMENKFEWHYKSPNKDELNIGLKELEK